MKLPARARRAALASLSLVAELFLTGLVHVVRLMPLGVLCTLAGRFGRFVGRIHPRSHVGLENLRLAFPEKTEAECRAILAGMWDQLFRTGAEYTQLDRILTPDPSTGEFAWVSFTGRDLIERLRDDGKPGIVFTAHMGNWELLQATAAKVGLDIAALFRAPNLEFASKLADRARARAMHSLVPSRPGAVYELSSVLDRGGHVGLLVDQKFNNRSKVRVEFFGRPANTSPLLAQLARRYECPVYGARAMRGPGNTHLLEMSGPYDLPRDGDGQIDIERATAFVTSIVEGWIREHPEQWLWIHKRWSL